MDIPSLEGMYYSSREPVIILSSLRPAGRRVFTCAHELGHHSGGDGTYVDELVKEPNQSKFDPQEFAADCFAGNLLVPKMAVERAFAIRHWVIPKCTPAQAYSISNYFGVGYSTSIHHLRGGLRLLSDAHAASLLQISPRNAQTQALGWEFREMVWVVNSHWAGRAIDVEVGDLIFVYGQPAFDGNCLAEIQDTAEGRLFRALQPGIGRLSDHSDWCAFTRVSRRAFFGRSIFRHLEEEDTEDYHDY